MRKSVLFVAALALSTTSAFAGGLSELPVPSFNDAPDLYSKAPAIEAKATAQGAYAGQLAGFPAPSFNDAPQMYAGRPVQPTVQARLGGENVADAVHPDPMHMAF